MDKKPMRKYSRVTYDTVTGKIVEATTFTSEHADL